jgi:hypothetical protein
MRHSEDSNAAIRMIRVELVGIERGIPSRKAFIIAMSENFGRLEGTIDIQDPCGRHLCCQQTVQTMSQTLSYYLVNYVYDK